jgi:hypothetical protein
MESYAMLSAAEEALFQDIWHFWRLFFSDSSVSQVFVGVMAFYLSVSLKLFDMFVVTTRQMIKVFIYIFLL